MKKIGRPSPKVIEEYRNSRWISTQIIEPETSYAVCHDGKQIVVRVHNDLKSPHPYKYHSAVYAHASHAIRRADDLNALFHTDKFEVYALAVGEKITHKMKDAEGLPLTR